MRNWITLCCLLCTFMVADQAQAWRLFGRRRTNTTSYSSSTQLSGSDQQRCQQKAEIMARQGRMSHGVAPMVGGFEGIGYGIYRNCNTCTPNRRMTLTGDGAAQSSNGWWYRCRSWR